MLVSQIESLISDPRTILTITNQQSRFVYVSDSYETITGHPRSNVIGRTNAEIYGAFASAEWDISDRRAFQVKDFTVEESVWFDSRVDKLRRFLGTRIPIIFEGRPSLANLLVEVEDEGATALELAIAKLQGLAISLMNAVDSELARDIR